MENPYMLDPCTITLPIESVQRAIAYWLGRCVFLREVRVDVSCAKQDCGYKLERPTHLDVQVAEIPGELRYKAEDGPPFTDAPALEEGPAVQEAREIAL